MATSEAVYSAALIAAVAAVGRGQRAGARRQRRRLRVRVADLALSVDASDEALFGGATLADIWDRGNIYASDPMCAPPPPPSPPSHTHTPHLAPTRLLPHRTFSRVCYPNPDQAQSPCVRNRSLMAVLLRSF